MKRLIRDNSKTRKGRPDQTGTLVGVRLQPGLLDRLDEWRAAQHSLPTRPEAIRIILNNGLKGRPLSALPSEAQAKGAAYAKAAAGRRIDKEQIGKSQSSKTKARRKNELTQMPSGMKSKSRPPK